MKRIVEDIRTALVSLLILFVTFLTFFVTSYIILPFLTGVDVR